MKKLLLLLVLLVGLVGIVQAEIVFEDDFETYEDGLVLQNVYGNSKWYNVNPNGDTVTIQADDGTVFRPENLYAQMANPGGTRTILREWLDTYITDNLGTFSFDINEPDVSNSGALIVKLPSSWLSPSSVNVSFSKGVVSAAGQSATYTLDAPYHVDIVVNMSAASGTYYGNTLPVKTYDVWVDYQLVLSNVPFDDPAAYRVLGINFQIPDADVATINLDNVELRNEAYLAENPLAASNPVPASMATGVALDATLSWDAGIDTATGSYADVSEYHVYIGGPVLDLTQLTDPNLLNDPNLTVTSAIVYEIGSNGGSWSPPAGFLERDITYAWRVDEKLTDGTIVPGYNWAFTTVLSIPGLNTELPADAVVDLGDYAELTVEATNPFTGDASGMSYQWMYSPDGITYSAVGTSSPILAIAAAQAADQGYYYCDVTIDSNSETLSSRVAQLIVKQTLAHWTMDQADFINGQHLDISGAHSATPPETPVFVAGAGPDMPEAGAAVIDPNSHGIVGSWNPLESTGQMTLSAWIKWNGTIAQYGNDILTKSDAWGADTMMWGFRIREITNDKAGIYFGSQPRGWGIQKKGVVSADTWTHVCLAYGSGQAILYLNGELAATDIYAALGTGTESQLTIGGTVVFPGAMDEVMIHNYAMSDEDAATLYYQTSKEAVCLYPSPIDFNGDCKVDLQDFAIFAASWLECGKVPVESCF